MYNSLKFRAYRFDIDVFFYHDNNTETSQKLVPFQVPATGLIAEI